MNYAPRLTYSYESLAPWVSRVAMVSEKVIVYEHADNPDNIHIHMLVMGCNVDVKTLKNWVKETLSLTPVRTKWAFPQTYKNRHGEPTGVDEGFVKYMTKGKLDPKYNKGFSPEFVAEQKKMGWDNAATPAAKRQSKAQKYYDDMVKWMFDKDNHKESLDLTNPYTVKTTAWIYMMQHTPMPMPYELSLYKASVIRFCFDYSIPLPTDMGKQFRGF